MKIFPPNTSIRTKLTVMLMLISVFILLSLSSIFVTAEIYSYRSSLENETATLASSLAENCKKLLLTHDYRQARSILATLRLQPNIRAAFLFDAEGQPVAEYLDPSDSGFILETIPLDFTSENMSFWSGSRVNHLATNWQHLSLFLSIDHENRHVGTIYLLSDLHGLYGKLSGVAFGATSLLGVMLGCCWCFAGRLQRPISLPLFRLVDTMQSITRQQNYSLRAKKDEQDEIGVLVDGFNRTLDQIELHRAELVEHQDSLEQTVAQRTRELVKAVEELDVAKTQAEAASDAKSEFLANITHELRTPLIGVLGMNELLFKTGLNDQQEMLADTVQKSGENLLLLINDVLDFSKIEAGELQLVQHDFSLPQMVTDVVALLSGQAEAKGLALYVDVEKAALSRVRGDEGRLRQILVNLLGNAIKFTEQGSVSVKLRVADCAANVIQYRFEISDTGIGLDDAAQQRIFSSFYQADGSNTRSQGGTGLGLAIVRQLVELFAGTIAVESRPGVGSCFNLTLPLELLETMTFPLPKRLLEKSVLLHLADSTAEQLLATQLQGLGLQVSLATSAADILYQLGAAQRVGHPFATLIFAADTELPDGQPLSVALRQDVSQRDLRRILLLRRKDNVALQKQEQRLYRPVSWSALHDALNRSWHALHLVEQPSKPQSDQLADQAGEVARPKVLLAGGGVASRELLKLSLAGLPLQTEAAGQLDMLTEKISQNRYAAVLLDLQSLSETQLFACLNQQQNMPPLFVLHAAGDSIAELESMAAGLLEKPASAESLNQLLQPILSPCVDLSSAVDGDSA